LCQNCTSSRMCALGNISQPSSQARDATRKRKKSRA
jgi:hypothetical protein